MTDKRLQIFAKAPVQGQVKTRLIPDLGEKAACDVYLDLLERTVSLAAQTSYKTQLWCAPDQRHEYFQDQAKNNVVELHDQYGSGLGERMHCALKEGLESAEKVVLIGSDCPVFTVNYLAKAFDALTSSDVVLGPAEDGGFVLVGCRKAQADMFHGVNWGDSYKTKADEDLELAEKEITALQEKLNALKIELSNANNTLVEKNALLKKIQQLLPNS